MTARAAARVVLACALRCLAQEADRRPGARAARGGCA